MMIKGFQKLSLIEYPGKLAAVVFVGKCNFRCGFCYNIDLVKNYKKLPDIPEKEILDFMATRKGLLDAVAITGGEPTIHKGLPTFLKKIKDLGFLTMIETNGSNPGMIKELIDNKLVDYIAMDIKAPLEKYDEVTGVKVDKRKIRESINLIINSNIDHEMRSTVLPKLHSKKDIIEMAKTIKEAKRYVLQQFRPGKTLNPKFKNYKPFSREQLESVKKECNKYVPTKIRG